MLSDVLHIYRVVYSVLVVFPYSSACLAHLWMHAHRQFRRLLEFSAHFSASLGSLEECRFASSQFGVICSTSVLLSSVMEKCSQSMWRFLVNSVSLLAGDSYDGSMTALVGEPIAMDVDVIFGVNFVGAHFLQILGKFPREHHRSPIL